MSAAAVNADPAELARFAALAARWWDPEGPLRPLHALQPARLEFVRDRVPLRGARVLDLGCGGGLFAEALAAEGAEVLGIDLAPELIRAAELHRLESGLPVAYRVASAEALAGERPGSFAVVCAMELIEHVPDPRGLLAAAAALLAPGGSLFVSTLNRTLRSFLLAILAAEHLLGLLPAGTHRYDRFIRPSELAGWLRAAGLEPLAIAGLRWWPSAARATLDADVSVGYVVHARKPR